jgi:hypothetical protein
MDRQGFLEYIASEFPTVVNNTFIFDLLDNLLDYALTEHNRTINGLQEFLAQIIPEITEEEIKPFIVD